MDVLVGTPRRRQTGSIAFAQASGTAELRPRIRVVRCRLVGSGELRVLDRWADMAENRDEAYESQQFGIRHG
jgi:hypothetical protein